MATKTPKLTLSSSRDIPFTQLLLSQANVRHVQAGQSIEDLAEDIARRGLLQGLSVRPLLDATGAETGLYEVPAGGRRYRAIELLIKRKRLARTTPVPCVVREAGTAILAEDDSLAENVQRAPLHPLDQFRALATLRAKGMGEEAVAAAFFVPVAVVRQRLRLAAVSERLLDTYAEDGMTLDQLMAFTVCDDHARQEQVWETVTNSWSKEPHQIRRLLTERAVRASDKRARFVGTEAYEQAGGVILRDLFNADGGGWLQDVSLLDRLVADRLQQAKAEVLAEGWKWVEAAAALSYDYAWGLRALDGLPLDFSDAERSRIEALEAEQAEIEAAHQDAEELPDAVDARLGEIETELARLNDRPMAFYPDEVARAGAFVTLDAEGRLAVMRGYVRPEDEAAAPGDGRDEATSAGGTDPEEASSAVDEPDGDAPASPDPDEDTGGTAPLPERLLAELSAFRTLALRDALARHPQIALTALLHKLAADMFRCGAAGDGLGVAVRCALLPAHCPDLNACAAGGAITARHEAWQSDLPQDDGALWAWLAALDDASRLTLLAHCLSFGVNALVEKVDRHGGPGLSPHGLDRRLAQAGRMAAASGLDLVEAGWTPTVGNYLGRVSKARVLDAVREARGETAAQRLAGLKKAEMAQAAEDLLAGTGWLPEMLRPAPGKADAVPPLPAQADQPEAEAPSALPIAAE